jgi:ribosome-binding factor A
VTDARITGDLREATVYISLFGSDEDKKADTLKAFKSANGYIRTEVGRRLESAIRRQLNSKKIHPWITA